MPTHATAIAIHSCFLGALAIYALGWWVRGRRNSFQNVREFAGADQTNRDPGEKLRRWKLEDVPEWGWMGFLFLLFYVTNSGLVTPDSTVAKPEPERVITKELLIGSIQFQLLFAIVTLFVMNLRGSLAATIGLRWPGYRHALWIVPACLMAMLAISNFLVLVGFQDWLRSIGEDVLQASVQTLQKTTDLTVLILLSLIAVLVAPVCEEIVFRGFLFGSSRSKVGVTAAAVGSSLMFGASHGDLAPLFPLTGLGLLLAVVYHKTGSIWAPISVHIAFNSLTVIVELASRAAG